MSEQENQSLEFQSMTLERRIYGENKGKLNCRIRCKRFDTTLDVNVPDDVAAKIMEMIAPALAAQVQMSLQDVARDHLLIVAAQDQAVIEAEPQDVVDDNA